MRILTVIRIVILLMVFVACACIAQQPKLVFIVNPFGINDKGNWLPTKEADEIQFAGYMQSLAGYAPDSYFQLTHTQGTIGDLKGALHLNYKSGTVDTQIAKHLGDGTLINHLLLGVQSLGDSPSFEGSYPVIPLENPYRAHDIVLGSEKETIDLNEHLMATQSLIVQFTQAQMPVLDELPLDFSASVSDFFTNAIAQNDAVHLSPIQSLPTDFIELATLQFEVAAEALRRDLKDVVTIVLGDADYEWIPEEGGPSAHGVCHNRPLSQTVHRTITNLYATFLYKLKSKKLADGSSVFDNTLVVFVSNEGSCDTHSNRDAAFMYTAGKNVTGLKTHTVNSTSDSLSRLLGAIASYFGLAQADTHLDLTDSANYIFQNAE